MILALLLPAAGLGHAGEAIAPHDLWSAWEFDPGVAAPLAISALLYLRGARVSRGVTPGRQALFWSGWVSLFLALVSPLHPLGEALFSAHMTQHEILMLVSAPLLVLSRPMPAMLWGVPLEWRRRIGGWTHACLFQRFWRGVTLPSTAWIISAVALWTWHVPALFDRTLSNEWVHAAQHASFFGSALLFWWSLFEARGGMHAGSGVVYIFTTAIHTSILGALLTFAPAVWYAPYSTTTQAWGLSPLEDQQLGGLIMWVPASAVYIAAGLWLFARWMRESERMVLRSSCAD